MEGQRANKGLAGLIAGDTNVSKVDVNLNTLLYRGYDINDLCEKCSFLEVAHLLLLGHLPNQTELKDLEEFEKANRILPQEVHTVLAQLKPHSHPMDIVKIGVSVMGALNENNQLGTNSEQENLHKAKLLLAQIPSIVANGYRHAHKLEIIPPDKSLGFAHNLLYMITGKKDWSPLAIKTMDNSLTLYAEHGYNASTFSARVTSSTLSDLYSAISSAIGSLKGPLHGGANEQVMYMLLEVAEKTNAEPYLRKKLEEKAKIMGFGHRLYRTGDSRTARIKKLGEDLGKERGITKWHEISDVIEDIMIKEKNIYPNLDFPAATAYYLLDIPIDLFTPIFAASRITGWCAHIIEQQNDNKLIRPSCGYTGEEKRNVPPIDAR